MLPRPLISTLFPYTTLFRSYVEDGIERGAARCNEVLHYGGMGHTAGVHTRSREAAIRYGGEMPASRVTVNTPTTHGRSEEHTSELQSHSDLVCRLLLEKKKK